MNISTAVAIFSGSKVTGEVFFQEGIREGTPGSLITFNLSGLEPFSVHAIHIHEFGDTSEGCKSLGPHWNPTSQTHVSIWLKNKPRHAGYLISNIEADNTGSFYYYYFDPMVKVSEIFGRSIVIHDGIDDLGLGGNEESLKTGNAGSRMACAIIARCKN